MDQKIQSDSTTQTKSIFIKQKCSIVFYFTVILLLIIILMLLGYIYFIENSKYSDSTIGDQTTQKPTSVSQDGIYDDLNFDLQNVVDIPLYYWSGDDKPSVLVKAFVTETTEIEEKEDLGPTTQVRFPDNSVIILRVQHGGATLQSVRRGDLFDLGVDAKMNDFKYRYSYVGNYYYSDVQMDGVCLETIDGPVNAPCVSPSMIQCIPGDRGFEYCDRFVKLIDGVDYNPENQ